MSYQMAFKPDEMRFTVIPRPFPGKYPTRIVVTYSGTAPQIPIYAGKPSPGALRKVFKAYIKPANLISMRLVSAWEFDRNGLIWTYRGGNYNTGPVLPVYYPIPREIFRDLNMRGRFWLFFERFLSVIGQTPIYINKLLWHSSAKNVYASYVSDCVKRVDPSRYAPLLIQDRLFDEIADVLDKRMAPNLKQREPIAPPMQVEPPLWRGVPPMPDELPEPPTLETQQANQLGWAAPGQANTAAAENAEWWETPLTITNNTTLTPQHRQMTPFRGDFLIHTALGRALR